MYLSVRLHSPESTGGLGQVGGEFDASSKCPYTATPAIWSVFSSRDCVNRRAFERKYSEIPWEINLSPQVKTGMSVKIPPDFRILTFEQAAGDTALSVPGAEER